jgi:L-lactate dehydrogenase complex protein LldF
MTAKGHTRRIDAALHDAQLQTALGRAAARFPVARAQAFGALRDSDEVRARARAARARALVRLDEQLEQLAGNIAAAGGHVHWAWDAAEACAIIAGLARDRAVNSIVKGKSMVSEEIHLNAALEREGFRVIETDLGEYILQLAGEAPSHITAPAIHWTREQVGELFHRKLGIPLTDDIGTMTAAARDTLRGEYLRAGMGITGVNFGVAATGTLVLVENEGNGRLTSTAPRCWVGLMGIERVAASMDDLDPLLQVLARSATGQKLTAYTSFMTGPARAGEDDGPEEMHLVLVDNGRSRILGSEYFEVLYCIRCGACLNACPVYGEIGGHAYGSVYPGPIGAVLTPLLDGLNGENRWLPYASSLCGACEEACPVRIPLPDYLLRLRRDVVEQLGGPATERLGMRAYRAGTASPRIFGIGGKVARTALRVLGQDDRVSRLPPPFNSWTHGRDFPTLPARSFRQRWAERTQPDEPNPGREKPDPGPDAPDPDRNEPNPDRDESQAPDNPLP